MAAKKYRTKRKGGSQVQLLHVHKPRGLVTKRVQKIGPERFGILSVDPAKARSKWMLCDFYGTQHVPPTVLVHSRGDFEAAITQLRHEMSEKCLKDLIVAVERTGEYHLPVKRAYRQAGFEVRIVHPFATKQFRQPANPGTKTDEIDLAAIHRAAVNGFGLLEHEWGCQDRELQLLTRYRRDQVNKCTAVYSQMHEHLHACMPGYEKLFDDIWESQIGLFVARETGAPQTVQQLGEKCLTERLREQRVPFRRRTLERIIAWSGNAAKIDHDSKIRHRIWKQLDDDRKAKRQEIQALERDIASLLVGTPYVLLLSIPGINVVSTADFAGEMGPISNYANARHITGRAGLFPSRYQSDLVDHCDGPLVRCCNRRLRTAILSIADNLICCNDHFRARADLWKKMGKDPRRTHVKVASRFSRIAFLMVAGRQVFAHPCCQKRSYILDKLITFHREHKTPAEKMLVDMQRAVGQLPRAQHAAEAQPLAHLLDQTERARGSDAQAIGEILPLVLAKLGAGRLQSNASGGKDPS